ncbi:MAG: hypothetical protein KDK78_09310, partial [Chlamydiia bacterium]|nr:hypothetical protein [Chlamydiia bacterium]
VRFSDVWTALCDANRKGTKGAADDLLKVYAALIEPSEDWLNRKQWHRVHHLYCSILNSGALLLGKNFDESSYADVPGDRTSLADVVAQVRTERLELKTWDAAVGVMRLDGLPSLIEAKKAKH